jgi:subfamily B ATP-binding cassette protein MsbA
MSDKKPKRKVQYSKAMIEARALVSRHRNRLILGLGLMLVNRLLGLVMPASTGYIIDEVIGNGRTELLATVAVAVAVATLFQAITTFSLSQILGVAAQRAITDMRKRVFEHVSRLPVSYFDSMKTGELISRIMTDAEGIRNLVGTGLVQLTGGVLTAVLALGVLFYLNWYLTLITMAVLGMFGAVLAVTFKRLRPLFRMRGQLNADVTGRLSDSCSHGASTSYSATLPSR